MVRGYQAPKEMLATSYKSTLVMSSTFAPQQLKETQLLINGQQNTRYIHRWTT